MMSVAPLSTRLRTVVLNIKKQTKKSCIFTSVMYAVSQENVPYFYEVVMSSRRLRVQYMLRGFYPSFQFPSRIHAFNIVLEQQRKYFLLSFF